MTAAVRPRILVGGMTDNPGGKEKYILSAIEAIRSGADFVVLSDIDRVAFQDELEAWGVEVARVPHRRKDPLGHLRGLWRLIRDGRFQTVWLHQTVISSLEPLLFAALRRVPNRALHSHSSRNMSGRLSGILHAIQRPFAPLVANRRLACSDEAAKWFFPFAKWTFAPNAFDVAPFDFDPDRRSRVREALGLPDTAQAILHVARLGPAKNHAFDIEIMRVVRERGDNAILLLCGDGPYREDLERAVHEAGLGDHIRFLGVRSDVPDLLQAADAAILPSTFEGLPYTALEAQAAGLPILLSDAVSTRAEAGGDVVWLPIDQGPGPWVEALAALRARPATPRVNAIRGTRFDMAEASQHFNALLDGRA